MEICHLNLPKLNSNKTDREKNKSVLKATLNYLLEYHTEDMVFDDYSPSKQWYLSELQQTEKDIAKGNTKQLEKRLQMHISLLRERNDQNLNAYIKKHTGYAIDIFEQYKAEIIPILAKGEIEDNDKYKVERFLKAYGANPVEQENVAFLKTLLAKYEAYLEELMSEEDTIVEEFCIVTQGNKSWTLNAEERKEMRKNWLLAEEIAPNGIDKLHIQFSGKGEHALTYVNIYLTGGVGAIYSVFGEKLPIKAYWKDNHTVVVETKEDYKWLQKYAQVSSYGEIVKIEYITD